MNTPQPTTLYRFHNRGHVVQCTVFRVLKHTPRGCWIRDPYDYKRRFILNDARKRFAYPTEELAKESFLARKECQLGILESQIKNIKHAVVALNEGRLNDHSTLCNGELEFV